MTSRYEGKAGTQAALEHTTDPTLSDEFVAVPRINFSKIAFFSSHGGSSARGVIGACGRELRATPAIVLSNNPESAIIEFARAHSIPNEVVNLKSCGSELAVQQRILEILSSHHADLIVLSGYMKKMGSEVINQYGGRIFNIHPSLLPKHGGQGMYGINVHKAVIEAKEKETGITIHEVNQHYDQGAIVSRLRVPVHATDTPETLADRVKALEPSFLVRTLKEMQR